MQKSARVELTPPRLKLCSRSCGSTARKTFGCGHPVQEELQSRPQLLDVLKCGPVAVPFADSLKLCSIGFGSGTF